MPTDQLVLEVCKILVAIIGAIVVAWYWNRQRHRLEQYRYLDERYNALLAVYFEHPQYGDPRRTSAYRSSFRDAESMQYHYLAMRVHTLLETILDISNGEVPEEWRRIVRYHSTLHAEWLADNRDLHGDRYLAAAGSARF